MQMFNEYELLSFDQVPTFEFPVLQDLQHQAFFLKMRQQLEAFTKQWNDNEDNRDKSVAVTRKLSEAKEEIRESLTAMMERDGKIEDALARGQNLQVASTGLRKNASAVNR